MACRVSTRRKHRRGMTTPLTAPATTRAVVLGGSLAGLLAARVLADHFDEVLVVDRDDVLAASDEPRRGVPQGAHLHALLLGGLQAVERLLPGWTETMRARGATVGDVVSHAAWWFPHGRLAGPQAGVDGVAASRPLVEAEVRRRVAAIPNVRLRGRTDVAGVVADADRRRVVGARLVDRAPGSAATAVPADLVVDATGRGSRTPAWLAELGYPPPPEEQADLGVTYVTRQFRVGPFDPALSAYVVTLCPPERRSGILQRVEGDRWILTLAGHGGESAPADLDGFRTYARSLPLAELAAVADTAEPLGDAVTYRFPAGRWRHYERCDRLPEGLVVLGDAVCSFDPTFGQGMSSAAMQVEVLQRELAAGPTGLGRRVAAGAAGVARSPWLLATGTARRMPGMPRKPLPERVLDRYLSRLVRVATYDDVVAVAFLRVVNLAAPPPSLLSPRVAARVLAHGTAGTTGTRRTTGTAPPGPGLPAPLPADADRGIPSRDGRLPG
jgi:2-polyprenyl-6-methoxyphenol hydroxylase-like FAD-dependent oxidoreductase